MLRIKHEIGENLQEKLVRNSIYHIHIPSSLCQNMALKWLSQYQIAGIVRGLETTKTLQQLCIRVASSTVPILLSVGSPSCLQATKTLFLSQLVSHTVLHTPS